MLSTKDVFATYATLPLFFSGKNNLIYYFLSETTKLRTHLELLREEYVKLQNRHAELEKKYQIALATAGSAGEDSGFISKLLSVVADLFNREKYRCGQKRTNLNHCLKEF